MAGFEPPGWLRDIQGYLEILDSLGNPFRRRRSLQLKGAVAIDDDGFNTVVTIGSSGSGQQGPPGNDGRDGNDGEPGTPGTPGVAGATGSQGPQGFPGPPGADGDTGATGDPGTPGPTGATGPAGSQGAPGSDGSDGADGLDGVTGPQGTPGINGAQGQQGPPGSDGSDGADGLDGVTGPQGQQGPIGPIGPQGAPGNDGADGADGLDGPAGIAGATGATGATGPAGSQGAPGNDGADGRDGETVIINNNTTTIVPGSTAISEFEADLGPGGVSGSFTITGLSGLTVGQPIMIQQTAGPYTTKGSLEDVADEPIMVTARAASSTTATAYWQSSKIVGGPVRFVFQVASVAAFGTMGPTGPTGPAGADGTNGSGIKSGVEAITISADTNNQAILVTTGEIRFNTTGAFKLTGIAATFAGNGDRLTIHQVGTGVLELPHSSASSLGANRYACPESVSVFLAANDSCELIRDPIGAWRFAGIARSSIPFGGGTLAISAQDTTSGLTLAAGSLSGAISISAGSSGGMTLSAGSAAAMTISGSSTALLSSSSTTIASTGGNGILTDPLVLAQNSAPALTTGNILVCNHAVGALGCLAQKDSNGTIWDIGNSPVGSIPSIVSISNSTAVLTFGSATIPANSVANSTTYRLTGHMIFTRGATVTPMNITIGQFVAGVNQASTGAFATVTTSSTGHTRIEGFLTILTVGVAGTAIATLSVQSEGLVSAPFAMQEIGSLGTGVFTFDSTISNTLGLQAVFSAAVPGTSMTAVAGLIERVKA